MADPDRIAGRQQKAVDQIRTVLKKRGAPEVQEAVEAREAFPGSRWSVRNNTVTAADVFLLTLAEDVADLAAIVDQLAERRGRRRNVEYQDSQ